MKRIIDIPDRTYDFIMGLNQHTFGSKYAHKDVQADIVKAVKESKPYSEPTGDLISREALKEAVKNRFDNSEYFPFHFLALIDNAPPVPLPNEQIAWEQGYEAGLSQGQAGQTADTRSEQARWRDGE